MDESTIYVVKHAPVRHTLIGGILSHYDQFPFGYVIIILKSYFYHILGIHDEIWLKVQV